MQSLQDEQAFRKKFPYPLIATNLKGAYSIPAPPDYFDPNTAGSADLIKHGMLWRRPAATDAPALREAWKKAFSRKWLAKDRIVPELEVQVGKTHRLKGLKKTNGGFTSYAWSGCVVNGSPDSFTSVIGYWVIPTVGVPAEMQGREGGWNSSSWIGIDGYITTNDVLQAGIEQKVAPSGNATYVAWYEWQVAGGDVGQFPYIRQTNINNFFVAPGHTIYCSVQYVNNNTAGQIYLANDTTGKQISLTLAPPTGASFNGSSAEWIMEAPDDGEPISALPSFSSVEFTSCLACSAAESATPLDGITINIVNPNNNQTLTAVTLGNDTVTIDFIG